MELKELIVITVLLTFGYTVAHNDGDCGAVEGIDDVRTKAPWKAAIFIRSGPQEKFKFITSGIVLSPTIVVTIFGGVVGDFSSQIRAKYKVPTAENIMIVLGINSTDLSQSLDQYSQIPKLVQVVPYHGPHRSWKNFHLLAIHLKERLRYTAYVRPPCYLYPTNMPQDMNSYEILRAKYPANVTSLLTGYTFPSINGTFSLTTIAVDSLSLEECQQEYRRIYKAELPDLNCARAVHQDRSRPPVCLQHNSLRVDFLYGKPYATGSSVIIPDKKINTCKHDTLYFLYIASNIEKKWIIPAIKCSPIFGCDSKAACLSWSQVCDNIKDCPGGEDEAPEFCEVMGFNHTILPK